MTRRRMDSAFAGESNSLTVVWPSVPIRPYRLVTAVPSRPAAQNFADLPLTNSQRRTVPPETSSRSCCRHANERVRHLPISPANGVRTSAKAEVEEDFGGGRTVTGEVERGPRLGQRDGVRDHRLDVQAAGEQGQRGVELGVEAEGPDEVELPRDHGGGGEPGCPGRQHAEQDDGARTAHGPYTVGQSVRRAGRLDRDVHDVGPPGAPGAYGRRGAVAGGPGEGLVHLVAHDDLGGAGLTQRGGDLAAERTLAGDLDAPAAHVTGAAHGVQSDRARLGERREPQRQARRQRPYLLGRDDDPLREPTLVLGVVCGAVVV